MESVNVAEAKRRLSDLLGRVAYSGESVLITRRGRPMARLVMKFGGTSVGSGDAIRQSADIVRAARQNWPRVVVVVSAMSGVTDALLKGAHTAANGDATTFRSIANDLRAKHFAALEALMPPAAQGQARAEVLTYLSEFEALCHAVHVLGEASARALDAISSLGERMSIHLMAAYLQSCGTPAEAIEASELIITDAHYQAANPIVDLTRTATQAHLNPLLDRGVIPVVTGFIARSAKGETTTLGRSGSDTTAALLGAALLAREVVIWTDVDGVLSADPRLVKGARLLPRLSYREAAEMTYFGAKVLHFPAVLPAIAEEIGLGVAAEYLMGLGMERVQAHEHALLDYALPKLQATHPDLELYGPMDTSRRGGVIPFNVPGVHPHDVAQVLDRLGIAVRAGHHCTMPLHERFDIAASARASFNVYNVPEEIDALAAGLRDVVRIFDR